MKLINIGFGNAVNADRILAVAGPESAPISARGKRAENAH